MTGNHIKKMKLTDFCTQHKIKYFYLNVRVDDKKTLLPYTDGTMPKTTDFKTMNPQQIQERNEKNQDCNYIAIDTSEIQQIDIDSEEAAQLFDTLLSNAPYYESVRKKLPHAFVRLSNPADFGQRFQPQISSEADFMNGQWVWADASAVVENDSLKIPKWKEPSPIKPLSVLEGELAKNPKSLDMIYDALSLIDKKYCESHYSWLRIAAGCYNSNPESESIFDEWSKQAPNYGGISKLWRQFQRQPLSNISTGTLCYYAKVSDPDRYLSFKAKHLKSPLEIIESGPKATAEFIAPELKTRLVYSNKRWFVCGDKNTWAVCNKPDLYFQKNIIEKLDEQIRELVQTKPEDYDEKIKKCIGIKTRIDSKSFNSQLTDYSLELLNDKDFYKRMDSKTDYLAFQNGLLNLETKTFRKGFVPDDYISQTLDYDYPQSVSESDLEAVKTLFRRICNDDPDYFDFVMRCFGYALTGQSDKIQKFFVMVGLSASNGKSSLLQALQIVFSIYVQKIKKDAFLLNNSTAHKSISKIAGKRIIFSEELPQSKGLNTELLKDASDGKTIENTALYREDETIKVQGKIFLTSNHTPTFESDNGVDRRFVHLSFESKFLSKSALNMLPAIPERTFLEDQNWERTILSLRDAVVHLMIDYANKFYTGGLVFPDYVMKQSEETCEDNNYFSEFWNTLEIGSELYLAKSELDLFAKPFKYWKDEFKKRGIKYDSQKRYKLCKGCFIGVAVKHENEYDDPDPELERL